MTRRAAVPGWGDSGSLYQYVEIAEPGEPGYPTPRLPDGDPWAPAVNRVIDEIAGEAEPVPYTLNPRAGRSSPRGTGSASSARLSARPSAR